MGKTCPPPSWCAAWRRQPRCLRACCRCPCGPCKRGRPCWARGMRCSACAVIGRWIFLKRAACWAGCRRCRWTRGCGGRWGVGCMKRLFDLIAGACAGLVLLLPIVLVALAVRLTSKGPALYWSDRVGRNNKIFKMPKFRSMQIGTPAVATHLLSNPDAHLTPIGSFLRKSSLDELPQLWSILVGDMSFVGPRPALFNQHDLIELRTQQGVHELVPGLTGWAQVNGRDELPIPDKVKLDVEYLHRQSLWFDIRILWLTLVKGAQAGWGIALMCAVGFQLIYSF